MKQKWLIGALGLILPLLPACAENAQQGAADPLDTMGNYRKARAIVGQARQALRGPAAASELPGLSLQGSGRLNLAAQFQGLAPGRDTWVDYRESLAYDPERAWLGYAQHYQRPDGSQESLRFVYMPSSQMRLVHLIDKFAIHVTSPEFADTRRRLARMMPPFLLHEALNDPGKLRYLGRRAGPQGDSEMVSMSVQGQALTLLFDAENGLLTGFEYLADVPLLGDTLVAWEYFPYQPAGGFNYPSGYRIRVADKVLQEVRYVQVSGTEIRQAEVFQIPPEIRVPRPPEGKPVSPQPLAPTPRAQEIDEGVYRIRGLRGGFHVLFVDVGDFAVAFEAPTGWLELNQVPASDFVPGATSSSVSRTYIEIIRRTLGEKPIRYLALSHHHGDHSGGLREFLAQGATIVTSAKMAGMAERAAARPHTLHPDSLRGESANPRLELFSGSRGLGEGPNTIELLEVRDNQHAQGLCVMHLPEKGILYVADLLYAWPQGGRPSPAHLPSARRFARWLRTKGLKPQRIYTSHGTASPLSWERLEELLEED